MTFIFISFPTKLLVYSVKNNKNKSSNICQRFHIKIRFYYKNFVKVSNNAGVDKVVDIDPGVDLTLLWSDLVEGVGWGLI